MRRLHKTAPPTTLMVVWHVAVCRVQHQPETNGLNLLWTRGLGGGATSNDQENSQRLRSPWNALCCDMLLDFN